MDFQLWGIHVQQILLFAGRLKSELSELLPTTSSQHAQARLTVM